MRLKTTKRYWCNRCGSYQTFTVCQGMSRAGDHGYCETKVWSCNNCGFSPFLPPKKEPLLPPKEEGATNGKGNTSNS